jgi:hypothetical protein
MSRRSAIARTALLGCTLLWTWSATASDAPPDPQLPTLRFSADALGSSFYEQIQRAPQFEKMNREALGSPIELRVYHSYRINRGSAAASGLLAAATLGIFPMVASGEHSVVYEVLVNGTPLSTYRYSKTLTHAHNLWSGADTTFGMGKDGLEWARSTVDVFLKDAASDARLSALAAEFNYYFGSPQQ